MVAVCGYFSSYISFQQATDTDARREEVKVRLLASSPIHLRALLTLLSILCTPPPAEDQVGEGYDVGKDLDMVEALVAAHYAVLLLAPDARAALERHVNLVVPPQEYWLRIGEVNKLDDGLTYVTSSFDQAERLCTYFGSVQRVLHDKKLLHEFTCLTKHGLNVLYRTLKLPSDSECSRLLLHRLWLAAAPGRCFKYDYLALGYLGKPYAFFLLRHMPYLGLDWRDIETVKHFTAVANGYPDTDFSSHRTNTDHMNGRYTRAWQVPFPPVNHTFEWCIGEDELKNLLGTASSPGTRIFASFTASAAFLPEDEEDGICALGFVFRVGLIKEEPRFCGQKARVQFFVNTDVPLQVLGIQTETGDEPYVLAQPSYDFHFVDGSRVLDVPDKVRRIDLEPSYVGWPYSRQRAMDLVSDGAKGRGIYGTLRVNAL